MRRFAMGLLLFGACAAPVGESGSDAGSVVDAGAADAGHVEDAGSVDETPDEYVAGMEKAGADGHFRLALIQSDPIPQDLTLYTWLIEVRDAEGQPIDVDEVVAEPTMPDHGHGTFPAFTPGVPAEGTGRYTLTEMDLFMAGVWRIELVIRNGETEDHVVFNFELTN